MGRGSKPKSPRDPLADLVDDRAIEDAAADRFGHAEFAKQAASVLQSIQTPANVAIYAPWGAGKTSLANLLSHDLDQQTCGFVYFDAFKYAEAPLRREFIRQVAKKLEVDEAKFDRGLYEEENRTGLSLEDHSVRDLATTVGLFAIAALLVGALLSLLLAHAPKKSLSDAWVDNLKVYLPMFFAPAVLLAPLFTLIGDRLQVNRKRYAPQSDEEFERLFRELIDLARKKNKGWDRVVVFIDELDRCAADEVASTLETLRTFLEVPRCVFVVAADRSVLETAVAKRSRQETPYNLQNPYYSAGSSYLDKIFQYQWQLPPMMSSSLTRFAERLVTGRAAGLWSEVNVGQVVSVLIPIHVQSPRRVKELLNAFAMAYRIAERRVTEGYLDGDPKARAAELAKLVCLQMEFPAFAADLPNEPRLPQLVLELASSSHTERPANVSEEVWERARAYAGSRAQLDVLIADDSGGTGHDLAEGQTARTPEQQVVSMQGHLLLRYLQKTRRIPGPEADLIFMEGRGFAFDLPTALATRLRAAATEGAFAQVVAAITPLPEEQQLAALRLLGLHVREALPGVEGQNALSTLLRAVGAFPQLDVSDITDELADAATVGAADYSLPSEDLAGAIRLGLSTSRPVGRELVATALAQSAATDDLPTAEFIAANVNEFPQVHLPRVADVIAALLVNHDWDSGAETVLLWTDERATELLAAIDEPLKSRISRARELAAEAESESSVTTATASTTEPATTEVVERKSPDEHVVHQLEGLLAAASSSARKPLLEALMRLTLTLNTQEARNAVGAGLPALGLAQSAALNEALLIAAQRRAVNNKAEWLNGIDGSVLTRIPHAKRRLEEAARSVWASDDIAAAPESDVVKGCLDSLAELAANLDWLPAALLVEAVNKDAAIATADQTTVAEWRMRVQAARAFEDRRLLAPSDWRSRYLSAATLLAATPPADEATRLEIRAALTDDVLALVPIDDLDMVRALFDALATAPGLTPSERLLARVRLAASLAEIDGQASVEPAEVLATLDAATTELEESTAIEATATWLSECSPATDEAWSVLRRFAFSPMPDKLRSGVRTYSSHLSSAARTELAFLALDRFPEAVPEDEFLEAIQFHDGELAQSVDRVVELFGRTTNEENRRALLRLWTALRLTHQGLNRRLLDDVLVPLAAQGKTSRELVLSHLNLVQALPKADKARLARAFEAAIGDDSDEWDGTATRLVTAGFMKQGGNRLTGRHPEHLT